MNQQQEMIVQQAIAILDEQIREVEMVATAPHIVRQYLRLKLERLEHEVFGGLFLDNKNQLITDAFLFRGTLAAASVYPREVVKEALKTNAAAVIFYHNHPSGVSEPSRADEQITTSLKDALALVDVRVLDHIVVGRGEMTSFAERGLI